MPVARNPNLRILPDMVPKLVRLTETFALPRATIVGILVWNDSVRPAKLAAVAAGPLSRVRCSCSMRPALLALARTGARRNRLSLNAYLEALIDRRLQDPGPLVVFPKPVRRQTKK